MPKCTVASWVHVTTSDSVALDMEVSAHPTAALGLQCTWACPLPGSLPLSQLYLAKQVNE